MKKSLLVFVAAAAAIFIALTGCETEKLSDTQLSISPSSATLAPGESITLTAQGGWDYVWDQPKHGYLSTLNGKKVTYTASATALAGETTTTYMDGHSVTENADVLIETISVHTSSSATNSAKTATAIITIKGK